MARPAASAIEPRASEYEPSGRIPFVIRIGVTGHRAIPDEETIAALVRQAVSMIEGMVSLPSGTSPVLVAISALAEGADRQVVREILARPDARLQAVLPLPVDEYLQDFESAASREEFTELLARSSEPPPSPPQMDSREEGYEWAGRSVVDHADPLVALWNGEPSRGRGGTAEIVAYARERVPLVWVQTTGKLGLHDELHTGQGTLLRDAARELDVYNSVSIPPEALGGSTERRRREWGLGHARQSLPLEQIAGWLLPYFVRADLVALSFQRRFRTLSAAVFLMAAAAVAVVAVQVTFFSRQRWLAVFEVLLLLGLLAIPGLNRRWRLHDRWISSRFLAERLRSLFFLALVGTGDRRARSGQLAYFEDPSEIWLERALDEVSARRPRVEIAPSHVEALRSYLAVTWIGDQVQYHRETARAHRRWDGRIIRITAVLFGVTFVAAVLHMLDIGSSNWGSFFIVLSLAIPVFGAAAHGIGTQRQFRRHSERYGRMVRLLEQLKVGMEEATNLEEIRRVAVETERIMREENGDWFGVMRFHDMELIT